MSMRNVASGFDAIRDAIGMYMDLRQAKYDRDRMTEADSRAARQLTLQEQRWAAEDQERTLGRERDQAEFLMTNYGGQVADTPTQDLFRRSGYSAGLESEMTLPSRNPSVSVGATPPAGNGEGFQPQSPMPSPLKTIEQFNPSSPTGRTLIRQPESERMRIAYYNAQARALEGDANRATRLQIAQTQAGTAERRLQVQQELAAASRALQQYTTNVASADRMRALMNNAEQFATLLEDRNYDNWVSMLRSNPLMALQAIQGDGLRQPPVMQPPPLPGLGGPGPQGSRFEEIK